MKKKTRTSRHFVLFIILATLALAQLSWWIFYQVGEGNRYSVFQEKIWNQQIVTAELWKESHPDWTEKRYHTWLMANFPDLATDESTGAVIIKSEKVSELNRLSAGRRRMFISEGVFFSILLLLGIGYMYWTMRREVIVEKQQAGFLSATSHELKTPITSLQIYLDTLAERKLSKEQKQSLIGDMKDDLDRLLALIERLLRTQSVMDKRNRPQLEIQNISEITSELIKRFENRIVAKKIKFTCQIEDGIFARVEDERWRIIVNNLLENAIKYTGQQGRVSLNLSQSNNRINLILEDNGIGFPKREQERIFQRFYRIGNEDTRSAQGTGLGLFLVREIAESFDGRAYAFSEGEQKGARFTVELPVIKE
ncbi:HAMP domain-containing histidine kinase [bacterium]|nr:HAMP domain-containing histidine kinase [bacterium]